MQFFNVIFLRFSFWVKLRNEKKPINKDNLKWPWMLFLWCVYIGLFNYIFLKDFFIYFRIYSLYWFCQTACYNKRKAGITFFFYWTIFFCYLEKVFLGILRQLFDCCLVNVLHFNYSERLVLLCRLKKS